MLGGCWLIPTFISFLPIMQSWNAIGIEDIVSERRRFPRWARRSGQQNLIFARPTVSVRQSHDNLPSASVALPALWKCFGAKLFLGQLEIELQESQ